MKKKYLSLFILAIGAAMFTACTDDDINGGNENPDVPLAELSKPKANPWLAQEDYHMLSVLLFWRPSHCLRWLSLFSER